MPRAMQTSFAGGEWSPRMDGRVDIGAYRRACSKLQNFVVWPHGAAEFRPGFRFIAETKTSNKFSIMVPFEFSTVQAYVLEFGDQTIRFFKDQGQIMDGGNPYEISSPYFYTALSELKFVQSADVLYIVHPDYAPRKLTRTGHTAWTLTEISFRPPPTAVIATASATGLTLAATTGKSVLLEWASGYTVPFQSGDINRIITSGAGRARIIGFIDSTEVIVEIIDAFSSTSLASGSWAMYGTPYGSLTPGAVLVANASTTLESLTTDIEVWKQGNGLGGTQWTQSVVPEEFYRAALPTVKPAKVYIDGIEAIEGTVGSLAAGEWGWGDNDAIGASRLYVRLSDDTDPDANVSGLVNYFPTGNTEKAKCFRPVNGPTDIGKYVYINGGLIKITHYSSGVKVSGVILKELSTADPSLAWTLESEIWTAALGYPSCATFHQDRLMFGGSTSYPQTIWGSVVGDYENFSRGTNAADSLSLTLNARRVNAIKWMVSRGALLVGTYGGEWKVGTNDALLTPTSLSALLQTSYGSEGPEPVAVSHSLLFLERHARKLREFAFDLATDGFVASDRTILAEHITKAQMGSLSGILSLAYQQNPIPTIWCVRADGNLVALTYIPEEDVYAWHEHTTDGGFESVAVIPGDGYDEVWAIVKRTVDGALVRYVEMMEPLFDSTDHTLAKFLDSGLAYFGGATSTLTGLDHLEGETVGVVANGGVHADRTVSGGEIALAYEATTAYVGLKYTGVVRTMRLAGERSQGLIKRIGEVLLRFYRSLLAKVGPDENTLDEIEFRTASMAQDSPPDIFTGDKKKYFPSNSETDGFVTVVQDRPMPMTLLALVADAEMGD